MTHALSINVPKRSGTYADSLEAIGTASLLEELHFASITIKDSGTGFLITAQKGPPPEEWPTVSPGFPYVWKRSEEYPDPPALPHILDYLAAKEQNEVWKKFNASQKTTASKKAPLELGLDSPERPAPEYFTAAMLESMRKGWNGDRDLALWVGEHPVESLDWVRSQLLNRPDPPGLPQITNSQIFNPIGGKGLHHPKTTLSSPGSLPDALIRPFAEWMKFRGLWEAMLLYRSGDDFKFFVLQPTHLSLSALRAIHRQLRSANLWGGVRLDISATFESLRALLHHSTAMESAGVSLWGRRPRSLLGGLRLAFFKSLGTAAALMNESLFPLPDWFIVNSPEDVTAYSLVINDTIGEPGKFSGCLGTLQEDHSDDGHILQQYRAWLLSGELTALLEFHSLFAAHVMSLRAANKYAREFYTTTLDTLFERAFPQETALQSIIKNEGFLSVARAVRDATIYADFKGRPVSFGLAQKWKQKLKSGDAEFLAAVAEFIQEQNWLTQNRFAGRGHVVLTTHLDELVTLLDQSGAELVGSLLLAYGYSRPPKSTSPEQTPELTKDSSQ